MNIRLVSVTEPTEENSLAGIPVASLRAAQKPGLLGAFR
jgi:hypothetical protein